MLSSPTEGFLRFFAQAKKAAFQITSAAAKQIKQLLIGDMENTMLRIDLKNGGCAGMQYDFDCVSRVNKNDHVFEKDGAKVVLNDHALLFLRGATLDYVSDKFSSTFKVELPVESEYHTCTCGKSVGKDNNPGQCSHN